MSQRDEQRMVAYALEAEPLLLPYLPELLADLEELGSDAEHIREVIGSLPLAATARIIDLGCGKGATALEIAAELKLPVTGIDLFEPFVQHCMEASERAQLQHLCRFQQGDIVALAGQLESADVAVFAALGDVLGTLADTVRIIRQYVKPGGYLLISDVYLKPGASNDFPGFERYAELPQTRQALTACGDRLLQEHLDHGADSEIEEDDGEAADEAALILARAQALAAAHPQVADALLAFARQQAAEHAHIDQHLADGIWVLQRSEAQA